MLGSTGLTYVYCLWQMMQTIEELKAEIRSSKKENSALTEKLEEARTRAANDLSLNRSFAEPDGQDANQSQLYVANQELRQKLQQAKIDYNVLQAKLDEALERIKESELAIEDKVEEYVRQEEQRNIEKKVLALRIEQERLEMVARRKRRQTRRGSFMKGNSSSTLQNTLSQLG